MGYSPKASALLNIPSGVVDISSIFIASFAIRITPGGHRWLYISLCALIAATGAAMLSFLPSSPSHNSGRLAGMYLIHTITATLPLTYHYASVNVSGHTKRSFLMNAIAVGFGVGNIIGPQSFRAKDAPVYRNVKVAAMCTELGLLVCMVLLARWYVWENRKRDRKQCEGRVPGDDRVPNEGGNMYGNGDGEAWKGLTDRGKKSWRYVY